MPKNKITTQGYFVKRIRDSGYVVDRIYSKYNDTDPRKWTIVINPSFESIFITCRDNGEWPWRGLYEFSDNGVKIPRGFHVNTESVDVVVHHLKSFKVHPTSGEVINNSDGSKRQSGKKTKTT
jgi:hypothetical protein